MRKIFIILLEIWFPGTTFLARKQIVQFALVVGANTAIVAGLYLFGYLHIIVVVFFLVAAVLVRVIIIFSLMSAPVPSKRSWQYVIFSILFVILHILPTSRFIFSNSKTSFQPYASNAMNDAIFKGERVAIKRINTSDDKVKRYDIVRYFNGENMTLGRVIGLPRERVSIVSHSVFIDGQKIEDPNRVLREDPQRLRFDDLYEDTPELDLQAGEYFILADNRLVSLDSRILGPIPSDSIDGVVRYVLWSKDIDRIGLRILNRN